MLSANSQATLLLTAYFSKDSRSDVKPLTNKEWGNFAFWLHDQGRMPEELLSRDLTEVLAGWSDNKVTPERLQALLNRGSAMAMAMEKWSRAGLWVMTRSDRDYPKKLKAHLSNQSPPVFFGCGNRNLLGQQGIAVIGSRDTVEDDLQFSRQLGARAANSGYSVVSGGAKGVDESAMLGALEAEGTSVGILANDLLRAATSAKYRQYLMSNNLVLISPFYPEAGFNAGNAMQRNKYIYCLSEAAIAVHSGTKGGTWNGALEDLKHGWVPLWVRRHSEPVEGNASLVEKGATWLPENLDDIDFSTLIQTQSEDLPVNMDIVSTPQPEGVSEPAPAEETVSEESTAQPEHGPLSAPESVSDPQINETPPSPSTDVAQLTLYEHFLLLLKEAAQSPKTVDELIEATQLHKTQLNEWLKQALAADKITKLNRPVRYQWKQGEQQTMFQEK